MTAYSQKTAMFRRLLGCGKIETRQLCSNEIKVWKFLFDPSLTLKPESIQGKSYHQKLL